MEEEIKYGECTQEYFEILKSLELCSNKITNKKILEIFDITQNVLGKNLNQMKREGLITINNKTLTYKGSEAIKYFEDQGMKLEPKCGNKLRKYYNELKKEKNIELNSSSKERYLTKTSEFFGENKTEREFLEDYIGEEGLVIFGVLMNGEVDYKEKKRITDEEISEKIGLSSKGVRKILYKLYDYRLASYIRTKNKEIAWYEYYWKLDGGITNKLHNKIILRKKETLHKLEEKRRFIEDAGTFFICEKDEFKIPFSEVSESNFKCTKCNSPLEHLDNESAINSLEIEISKLQKEIGVEA
jgi:transcription initiation factor TFIIE subunit alpha